MDGPVDPEVKAWLEDVERNEPTEGTTVGHPDPRFPEMLAARRARTEEAHARQVPWRRQRPYPQPAADAVMEKLERLQPVTDEDRRAVAVERLETMEKALMSDQAELLQAVIDHDPVAATFVHIGRNLDRNERREQQGRRVASPTADEIAEWARTANVPDIPRMRAWIAWWYTLPGNEHTGGNLHIVVDDENVGDSHLDWAKGYCDAKEDRVGSDLVEMLRRMHRKARQHAVALDAEERGVMATYIEIPDDREINLVPKLPPSKQDKRERWMLAGAGVLFAAAASAVLSAAGQWSSWSYIVGLVTAAVGTSAAGAMHDRQLRRRGEALIEKAREGRG